MYPNVRAEMARRNLTVEKMAELCGMNYPAFSQLLNGKRKLTYDMALKIKSVLGVNIPLEVLFAEKAAVL
jgi:plasmid maintenance system antidote protein VapI